MGVSLGYYNSLYIESERCEHPQSAIFFFTEVLTQPIAALVKYTYVYAEYDTRNYLYWS